MTFENILNSLLRRPGTTIGPLKILLWWEWRRLPYNLLVGAAGLVTLLAALALAGIAEVMLGSQFSIWEPSLFAGGFVILYGFAANVFSTAGWVSEILVARRLGRKTAFYGPVVFVMGTVCSVFLTLLPAGLLTLVMLVLVSGHR